MNKIIALTALILLFVVGYADAGCAVVRKAYVAPTYYAATSYAYSYTPATYGYTGYYFAGYDQQQQLIKDQAAFIKLQTEAYQQLRLNVQQGNPAGNAAAGHANFEAFAKADGKCINCHQDGTKAAEENGFVMFEKDGKISVFSLPERRRMDELIRKGQMPPGGISQQLRQEASQLLSKK